MGMVLALTGFVVNYLGQHAVELGKAPTVNTAANLFKMIAYNNKDNLLAGLIVAGYDDKRGGQVYSIPLGGSRIRVPWACDGSGSGYIKGFIDSHYRPGMSKAECLEFVQKALTFAMSRDGSSGGVVRTLVITKDKAVGAVMQQDKSGLSLANAIQSPFRSRIGMDLHLDRSKKAMMDKPDKPDKPVVCLGSGRPNAALMPWRQKLRRSGARFLGYLREEYVRRTASLSWEGSPSLPSGSVHRFATNLSGRQSQMKTSPPVMRRPSLTAFCDGLRRGGVRTPAGEGAPNDQPHHQAWPRLRSAARRKGPDAAAALAAELDAAQPEDAQRWIGAAARLGNAKAGSFTALHAAAQANAVECVQLLLERRARATVTEPGAAMTPLHYAAMAPGAGALDVLLKAKAPLTVRDARGQSLLHAAARSGRAESLRRLLQASREGPARKASRGLLEWSDRWARSAVHWASLNGHSEVLRILLDAKAPPAPKLITERQMAKRTHLAQERPLDLARRVHGPDSEVVHLLLAAMRDQGSDDAIPAEEEEFTAADFVLTLSQGGLDKLASWELQRLGAKAMHRVQCRVFFCSDRTPAAIATLKSAEKVCAVVMRASGAEVLEVIQSAGGFGPAAELAVAAWVADAAGWKQALRTWWRFNGNAGDDGVETLTFKITCRRSGKRFAQLSSQGVAVAAAAAIAPKRGWRAQVRRPDVEVRILVSDTDVLVDLPLLVQSVPSGGGELCSAGMAAPVAWALARSAELKIGDRVLDPMCGKAVILVEAALSWPHCHYIGVDVDVEQLAGARSNALLAQASGARLDLLRGDTQGLPLPDYSVDAVICDVPFGRQYGTIEGCRDGLYKAVLKEFDRVVRSDADGRVILISSLEQEPWVLEAANLHSAQASWLCYARRELKLGFLDASIIVLRRPQTGLPAQGQPCASLPELAKRLWWETSAGRGDWASLKVSERPLMQTTRGREI
ncbi:psmB6 [Symbiodinium natans]|uniref:PsmB6 protein n=1 Tax=Symbiodinium natans TaxID=878477 RepID=A0A812M5U2_9DINO|nr:psmB6 [Symbiodinium natans]